MFNTQPLRKYLGEIFLTFLFPEVLLMKKPKAHIGKIQSKKDGSIYLYGSILTGDLTGWYRYSLKDDTLQYEEIKEEVKEVNDSREEVDTKDVIIVALITLSSILFLSLIAVTGSKRRRRKKKNKNKNLEANK